MSAVIAVLSRPPVAGATKTRLASAVGAEGAAHLAHAFLSDTLERCAAVRHRGGAVELELWSATEAATSEEHHPLVAEAARTFSAALRWQEPGDLGARMRGALDRATTRGARAIIVGSDAPTLPPRQVVAAIHALDHFDLVLGPAADGGFWLIGARSPLPAPIFDGVGWSRHTTRAATIAGARALGLRVASVAPWYDVDTLEDLRLLRAHLAIDPSAAPATNRVLASLNAGAP